MLGFTFHCNWIAPTGYSCNFKILREGIINLNPQTQADNKINVKELNVIEMMVSYYVIRELTN